MSIILFFESQVMLCGFNFHLNLASLFGKEDREVNTIKTRVGVKVEKMMYRSRSIHEQQGFYSV